MAVITPGCCMQRSLPLAFVVALLCGLCPALAVGRPQVRVSGRQLLVDGKPFHMKGVNWNPVRRGGKHPEDLDFRGFVETDAEIMALAGVNALRTYEPVTDTEVLDALWEKGIFVLNTVYVNAADSIDSVVERMTAVMDHPVVLMWVVGNEWNYNGFYQKLELEAARGLLRDAARKVRSVDSTRPIATVFGSMPDAATVQFIGDDVDIWGLNQYDELSFGPLFDNWAKLPTAKPMFLSEYGADAFNSKDGKPDEAAQAVATKSLTNEIVAHSSQHPGGVCAGGLIFEFADEWWKSGQPAVHDGVGAGQGAFGKVYPDKTFNEEWFGLVAYDGTQRAAFRAYAEIAVPSCAPSSVSSPGCGRAPTKATDGERLKACGAFPSCVGKLGRCSPGPAEVVGSCIPDSKSTTPMTIATTAAAVTAAPAPWTTPTPLLWAPPAYLGQEAAAAAHETGSDGRSAFLGPVATTTLPWSQPAYHPTYQGEEVVAVAGQERLPFFVRRFLATRRITHLGGRIPMVSLGMLLAAAALLGVTCAIVAWRRTSGLRGAAAAASLPHRRYMELGTIDGGLAAGRDGAQELLPTEAA